MPSSASFVLWFGLTLLLIPLSLWLLRRTSVARHGPAGSPRVVASVSLGSGQRLVTVEVGQGDGRQWLVLAVTAQHIRAVHTLPPQSLPVESACAPDQGAVPFSELFRKLPGAWARAKNRGAA